MRITAFPKREAEREAHKKCLKKRKTCKIIEKIDFMFLVSGKNIPGNSS
jgi:hypothetical protein